MGGGLLRQFLPRRPRHRRGGVAARLHLARGARRRLEHDGAREHAAASGCGALAKSSRDSLGFRVARAIGAETRAGRDAP